MKLLSSLAAVLLATSLVLAAEAAPEPFRIVATPSGCAIVFDGVSDEYRIDTLVDGGVTLGLFKSTIASQEKQLTGSCLSGFRVSPSADGHGSTIEMRPAGCEFNAVVRTSGSLKIVFEKVVDIGGPSAATTDRSYKIGVGDQLQITVYNEDLQKKVVVGADGTIDIPLLGAIKAAGRTLKELQDDLRARLAKDYIVNPQVAVEVLSYKSQFAFVTGPVKTPGKVPLEGDTTLKDALAAAGGFMPDAGYSIIVARQVVGANGNAHDPEKMTYARSDIESGLANLDLKPNDVITVAEKDYFFIQGEVHKPGKYEIRPGMTLLQAISVAEGLTDWADRKDIALNRTVAGQRVRKTINLKNVERQKEPDVDLAGGDIIIVSRRFL